MLEISFDQLDRNVFDFYNRHLNNLCEDRRNLVVDISNLETDIFEPNGISFPVLKLKEKILLGVLLWYMPKELSVLVNLWLGENWGAEFKEVKEVLLHSKDTALGYLLVQDRWNNRDFFGNILVKSNLESISRLKIRRRSTRRPKKKVFRRGYNDKGSLRPRHSVVMYDYRKLKNISELIEAEEILKQKITQLFRDIEDRLTLEDFLYCDIDFS